MNYITEYIASGHFQDLKKDNNDLELADSLFLSAQKFYNGNISEALLALAFATVPYKKVPIELPVLKAVVKYPLVSHNDSMFLKKNDQLPSQLFFNTPQNNYGDRDKLAHFFGSAYISYQSNIFDLGNLIGYFVEVFEESFKVQSKLDTRDLETNELGNIFGEMLKKNQYILPSRVLLLPTLKHFRYTL
ncbi:MAG: hypothetical protein R6W90_02255 [Ignavibacteriaceae bacterium]